MPDIWSPGRDVGVSASGRIWDLEDVRILESTQPGTLLYVARRVRLARSASSGRYQAALSQVRGWAAGASHTLGGSASLAVTCLLDATTLPQQVERWRSAVLASADPVGKPLQFQPLPLRMGRLTLEMDPAEGHLQPGGAEAGADPVALVVELSDRGAETWARAVREHAPVAGHLTWAYTYPRLLPSAEGQVIVHGRALLAHLGDRLGRSADGRICGTQAELLAAWDDLIQSGAIEIRAARAWPRPTPPLTDLVEHARRRVVEVLFTRIEDGAPGAEARYALRWRTPSDAAELVLRLAVSGWGWEEGTAETELASLLHALDESYLSIAEATTSVPVLVRSVPDPFVAGVVVSLSFSEGHAPVAAVFGAAGGMAQYAATSARPEALRIHYTAAVDFAPEHWPPIRTAGSFSAVAGDAQLVLKPGDWVRSHTVYLCTPGQGVSAAHAADALVLGLVYWPSGADGPIRETVRLTQSAPAELRYPVPPDDASGPARLSAVGTVGGRLVQGRDLSLPTLSGDLFLLADADGVRVVSREMALAADPDLIRRLPGGGPPASPPGVAPE